MQKYEPTHNLHIKLYDLMDPWNNNPSNYRPPPGFPPGPRPGQGQYGQPSANPSFPAPTGAFNEFAANYPPPPGPPPGYNPSQGPPTFPSSSYPAQTAPYGSPGMAPPMGRAPGPPMVPPNRPSGPPGPPHGPPPPGPQQQPFFQYSRCTGKKKALCIGINYFGQREALRGCINDARNVERFLCERHGYRREDIVVLTDDQQDPRSIPTKNNMLRAMSWLVTGAQPNDSLFFHFSGHGGQAKDTGGDEADGYDEVIYPVDFKKAGNIVDDQMHDIMVKPLPAGCRLTSIFDCCHSGSALDLPYIYSTEGKIKEPNLALEAGQGLLGAVSSYSRGDMGGVLRNVTGFVRTATSGRSATERSRQTKTSPADVISWSGCKDTQTSADAVEGGEATGAMSYAFILALTQQPHQTYQQLLVTIRNILRAKYSQKPQLSSSHPIDTSLQFVL